MAIHLHHSYIQHKTTKRKMPAIQAISPNSTTGNPSSSWGIGTFTAASNDNICQSSVNPYLYVSKYTSHYKFKNNYHELQSPNKNVHSNNNNPTSHHRLCTTTFQNRKVSYISFQARFHNSQPIFKLRF